MSIWLFGKTHYSGAHLLRREAFWACERPPHTSDIFKGDYLNFQLFMLNSDTVKMRKLILHTLVTFFFYKAILSGSLLIRELRT